MCVDAVAWFVRLSAGRLTIAAGNAASIIIFQNFPVPGPLYSHLRRTALAHTNAVTISAAS